VPDAITLPQLGESVTEGVITTWLVTVGEVVIVGQPLAEIATDKVDTEIPSPVAGVVTELRVAVDATVEVGHVIAVIGSAGAADPPQADTPGTHTPGTDTPGTRGETSSAAPPHRTPLPPAARSAVVAAGRRLSPKVRRLLRERELEASGVTGSGTRGRITPADVLAFRPETTPTARTRPSSERTHPAAPRRRVVASPLVRRLLREAGLTVAEVEGTGPAGRVTRDDVRRAAEATGPVSRDLPATQAPREQASDPGAAASSGRHHTVELSRIRRTIADRMHRSLQTTAQLTSVVEVDMTRLMTARGRAKDAFQRREGVALSPFPLTVWAVCRVLARHPALNAQIDTRAGTATYHRDIHLGIAVDTAHGLIVPTVRSAQDLSVPGLTRRIADLAERARNKDLRPDDVSDGTFTVTNTGSRGVMLDTPILNPPQVAILATTLIEKRPVVVTDEFGADALAIRQMSYLCLTYDHRLVDGADAARFLAELKHTLETRELLAEFAG
jgi:pyruvate dehydrogenase E2 component (dihydrolipoamide acetyltransferase)